MVWRKADQPAHANPADDVRSRQFGLFRRRLLGAAWDAPTTPGIEGRRREESVIDRATATFAASGRELSLSLHNRPYATAQDDWDRDVVTATILWAHELAHLRQLLVDLRQHVGQAEQGAFATIEPALSLTFYLSRLGHLRVDVQLRADGGLESEALLAFSLAADQSYLPPWIAALTQALEVFPPNRHLPDTGPGVHRK
jgi:hypothetical protein